MSEPSQELPPAPAKGALELATALSVATRIEPELIRAVRLRLLPHLDTGAEADLWFSDWVGARTPEAIALLPECLPYLRAALVEKLEREPLMGRLFSVIAEYHRDLSPALFLEEQVTWHSLTGDREAVTEQLNRALHALVQQNRTGLAGWFAEAWTRLPAEARASAAAWSLATVAGAHNPSLRPGGAMELALDDIAAIASAIGETRLGVLREGSALLLGDVQGSTPPRSWSPTPNRAWSRSSPAAAAVRSGSPGIPSSVRKSGPARSASAPERGRCTPWSGRGGARRRRRSSGPRG
ncbi:hypothetical protein H4K36_28725 [Streptomyces sp. DHE7-1]|nr:hypothetical protein [Streptomyces sp. DHE7-1]